MCPLVLVAKRIPISGAFIAQVEGAVLQQNARALQEPVAIEVRAALAVDDTRLGEVWRETQSGLSPEQIAAKLGVSTSGFVWGYLRNARAIELGELPSAPTVIRQCRGAMRSFINRHSATLSPQVLSVLEARIEELRQLSSNPETLELEDEKIKASAQIIESAGIIGIYVYTLPHYFNHPIEESDDDALSDRTLMKVGKSDSDVIRRFRQQERNTALPEDPRLLRVYTGIEDKGDVEKRIHALLSAADHRRNRSRAAGTEWFLTNLKFLDALAADMQLTTFFKVEETVEN
jgi:hypothetical protein